MGGTLKLAGALGLLLIAGAFLLAAPAEGAGVLLHEAPSQRCPTALSRRSGVPVQLMLRGGDDEDEDGDEEGEGGGDGEEESDGVMTPAKALKQVLYFANIHDGVLRGVKEVVQSLERGEAQLVVLAEDCDHGDYVALVEALCAEKGVYLMKVPEKQQLGEWAGLVKLDADAKVRKVCAASSVAVRDFGEQSEGLAFLIDHIRAETGGAAQADLPAAEGDAEEAGEMADADDGDAAGGEEEDKEEEEEEG